MSVILPLSLSSVDGLRVQPGFADSWWLAALLAVVFVAAAFLIERQTIDTPRAAKGRYAIVAFVILAILHVVFALGLRIGIWTPEDDPNRFHLLSAEENYRALDEYLGRAGNEPSSLERLEEYDRTFPLGPNDVPYFRDAWGRPLKYDAATERLVSAGRDGEFGTERDLTIPRPASLSEDGEG